MNCEQVRDGFSSLWEKELTPFEEKSIREHLSSCPNCQREFEQFEKTMQWLHSVGEVEVPEGFLPDLYKTMKERKMAVRGEKSGGGWFTVPRSFRLPIQAVAMVAIVFLVLYLTKMMPTSFPPSVEKKSDQVLTRPAAPSAPEPFDRLKAPSPIEGVGSKASRASESEGERRVLETIPETPRPKDIDFPKTPILGEREVEGIHAPQVKGEAEKVEPPSPKAGIMAYQQTESKGAARGKTPSPEPGKIERELAAKEKPLAASKPLREVILRIFDREKVVPQLHELVKQFGGEVVTAEGNLFLASLPTSSFPAFEKELAGLSSSPQADQLMAKKYPEGSLGSGEGVMREEGDEKRKELMRSVTEKPDRIVVRILLLEE